MSRRSLGQIETDLLVLQSCTAIAFEGAIVAANGSQAISVARGQPAAFLSAINLILTHPLMLPLTAVGLRSGKRLGELPRLLVRALSDGGAGTQVWLLLGDPEITMTPADLDPPVKATVTIEQSSDPNEYCVRVTHWRGDVLELDIPRMQPRLHDDRAGDYQTVVNFLESRPSDGDEPRKESVRAAISPSASALRVTLFSIAPLEDASLVLVIRCHVKDRLALRDYLQRLRSQTMFLDEIIAHDPHGARVGTPLSDQIFELAQSGRDAVRKVEAALFDGVGGATDWLTKLQAVGRRSLSQPLEQALRRIREWRLPFYFPRFYVDRFIHIETLNYGSCPYCRGVTYCNVFESFTRATLRRYVRYCQGCTWTADSSDPAWSMTLQCPATVEPGERIEVAIELENESSSLLDGKAALCFETPAGIEISVTASEPFDIHIPGGERARMKSVIDVPIDASAGVLALQCVSFLDLGVSISARQLIVRTNNMIHTIEPIA